MSQKQDLLTEWFEEVWNKQNLDAIDRFFEPDTEANGILPDMAMGSGDYRDFVPLMLELVEDIDIQIKLMTENGPWLQALYHVKARASHNGAPIDVMGQVCVRFEGSLMVETYNCFDFFGLFEQLGQLPEQSLALCLTGQSFQ
ncbi:hypothetical protein NBRC116601_08230 [Cognatishimia sp. WU-CL00825]|uniref:ester cyclase n=1 Tax=Cognatishimia sp. WU-CL00825 TaxID=3127658 RepID=UPI003108EA5D